MSAAGVLLFVVDAAIRAAVLASIVGVSLVLLRVMGAATRLCTWRLVLWLLLVMPAIGGFAPSIPWRLPAAAPAIAPTVVAERTRSASSHATASRSPELSVAGSARGVPAVTPPGSGLSWITSALVIYAAGVCFLLLRSAVGWRLARRLGTSATAVTDPAVVRLARSRWERLARGTLPDLAASAAAWVPMTLGVRRPLVLLPGNWRDWPRDKLAIVLIHELAHVARRDALTQRLSLLYRAVFWFSPVSWWLHRHLVQLGEQASDESVLAAGTDPVTYAETLLEFFAAPEREARRAGWHVGMARRGSPEGRIATILSWRGGFDMAPTRSAVAGLVLTLLPATAVVAAVRPLPAAVQAEPPASVVNRPTPSGGHGTAPTPPSATTTTAKTTGTRRGPKVTEGRVHVDTRLYATDGRSGNGAVEYQATPPSRGARPADEVKSTALLKRLQGLFTQESRERPLFRSRERSLADPRSLHGDRQEVICGLTVVRKSADIDPRIIIPPDRRVVATARRVEPDVCRPADTGRK